MPPPPPINPLGVLPDSNKPTVNFSHQQEAAIAKFKQWYEWAKVNKDAKPIFRLFGYAGTGKSTIANHLAEGLRVQYMAFTGKAASVMRSKGCYNASTIHSLIYSSKHKSKKPLTELQKQAELFINAIKELEPFTDKESLEAKSMVQKKLNEIDLQIAIEAQDDDTPLWELSENVDLGFKELFIIDECSMVDNRIGEDLLAFKVPILVLGDPYQLPPVGGEGFFTNSEPDFLLTEIHRQAKGDPILTMATQIRNQEPLDTSLFKGFLHEDDALAADKILVGRNATRVFINNWIREMKGFKEPYPVPGDCLVCLQNEKKYGVQNGTLWQVLETEGAPMGDLMQMKIKGEDGRIIDVEAHLGKLDGQKLNYYETQGYFTCSYGYALTVHKAQGSQWDFVIVVDESNSCRGNQGRWLYTAVTRAAKKLIVYKKG
jgi:exodeoxyribonuclease-5